MSREEFDDSQVPMAGGIGGFKEKDDEVTKVVEEIKPIFEERTGIKFSSIEVIHYRTQLVSGMNYFVKAKAKSEAGDEQIVHLRIYQPIRQKMELTAHQLGKSLEDKLEYFQ